MIAARDERAGHSVEQAAREAGVAATLWAQIAVVDREQIDRLVERTIAEFGAIDVLVASRVYRHS